MRLVSVIKPVWVACSSTSVLKNITFPSAAQSGSGRCSTCAQVSEKCDIETPPGARDGPWAAIQVLQKENQELCAQLARVKTWMASEQYVQGQIRWLSEIRGREVQEDVWKAFFQRRAARLMALLEQQHIGLPAKVIFRGPGAWSSSLWIDIGAEDNRMCGRDLIAKNSVVVVGNALVGVVEHVGPTQSLVRLLTDARLVPSVRVIRGEQQSRYIDQQIDRLVGMLQESGGVFAHSDAVSTAICALDALRSTLPHGWGDYYLAKGELHGHSAPLWRARGQLLQGVGFNYDYGDEEGPPRDLRTGEYVGVCGGTGTIPLIQEGDLLITTGMDGVFPPGLEVAVVKKVGLLQEGSVAYDIWARPVAADIDTIEDVWVMPAREYASHFSPVSQRR